MDMIKIGCTAYSYREYFNSGEMGYKDFIKEIYHIDLDGVELTLTRDRTYIMDLKSLMIII